MKLRDHAIALLLLVALIVAAVVVLTALHDSVPPWLETIGSGALVGAGVAITPGASTANNLIADAANTIRAVAQELARPKAVPPPVAAPSATQTAETAPVAAMPFEGA